MDELGVLKEMLPQIDPIAVEMLDKKLNELKLEAQQNDEVLTTTNAFLENLRMVTTHPRHSSVVPLSKFVYMDAYYCSSEFVLRYGENKVVASLEQTVEYVNDIIAELSEKRDKYMQQIEQLQIRRDMLPGVDPVVTRVSDNAVLAQQGNFVEIIETDDKPYARGRRPRFKTAAERDEYLMEQRKSKTEK